MKYRCVARWTVVIASLVIALQASTTFAAVSDLTTGLLRASEAPAGFTQSRHRVYRRYHHVMQVVVSRAGVRRFSSACVVPAALAPGWRQGVIQAFDTTSSTATFHDLQLCGYRFGSQKAAHSAYLALTLDLHLLLNSKQLRLLTSTQVGGESLAVTPKRGSGSDRIVFRHANAVIEIGYAGTPGLPASTVLALARDSNSRLQ